MGNLIHRELLVISFVRGYNKSANAVSLTAMDGAVAVFCGWREESRVSYD